MIRITGIAGSLREGSFNRALLRAAQTLAPDGVRIDTGPIDEIPPFNQDLEETDYPEPAARLKEQVKNCDGLLLVTPEYNAGVPGVLKNAFDWLSRPPKDIEAVFGNLPVALMGATPGGGGTKLSQTAWLASLRHVGTQPWFPPFTRQVYVARAGDRFDDNGELVDEETRKFVKQFLEGFSEFVEKEKSRVS